MKNFFTLLIVVFGIWHCFSQTETETTQQQNTNSSYITFNLTTPLSTHNPRYRAGFIQRVHQIVLVGLDVGYGNEAIDFFSIGKNVGEDYRLFEVRPQAYVFLNSTRKVKQYISLELFYLKQTETLINDRYDAENNDSNQSFVFTAFDRADFARKKFGFHLNYGVFLPITNNLGINGYAGIGLRVRENEFSNLINPREESAFFDGFSFFEGYRQNEGRSLAPDFSFGYKLYYLLH